VSSPISTHVISEVDVHDAQGFENYRNIADKTIAQYGGHYLVGGGVAGLAESGPPPNTSSSSRFPRCRDCAGGAPLRDTPKY
jgi:uncharacterized protein (DUF1330 family)